MTRPLYCLALCLLAAAYGPVAAIDASGWRIAGGRAVIEFNLGVLDPLGIELRPVNAVAERLPAEPSSYHGFGFEGLSVQSMGIEAAGQSVRGFGDGHLHYHGGVVLELPRGRVDLTDFRIVPHPGQSRQFELLDASETAWAVLDHGHFEFVDEARAFEIRHLNLVMNRRLAALTGRDGLVGQVIGRVHLRAPVVVSGGGGDALLGACTTPNWPTAPGFEADVALVGMDPTSQPLQFFRCRNCDGRSGGPMVLAPNATLQNAGTAEVPWWEQFSQPQPPYNNDQHPFLVWNLYRENAAGQLEQIGASGVKHAFFTVNDDCPCAGGNILWVGCSDTYSASTNDDANYVAPRDEIIAARGRWGRCNSFFDGDCDGTQETTSSGGFINRMKVFEPDLDPAVNNAARWFIEAWYVVRDDVDIFNTMGWREVEPAWNGSTWTFPAVSKLQSGPVVDAWVDPEAAGFGRRSSLVSTTDGAIRVAVRVEATPDERWRYDYFVMNHDFVRAVTAGTEPDLETVSSIGLTGFDVPVPDHVAVGEIESARADRSRGQNWPAQRDVDTLGWRDPGETPLNWGRGFRFSFVAETPPVETQLTLQAGQGMPATLAAASLAPAASIEIFSDSFE